ncbi:MAG TPA: DNA mismatch repair endonuclease MutL [Thermoanaerobaculaceae bacterium]|nr:DNA mismatch repair endonuclease MutL [Thermoanaerobaculaceae bacterium]
MPRIRILPDLLINQIAAGEVVERPASVLKELVENALDAGAHRVLVRLSGGGCDLVEVEDDGSGMEADDVLLAIERHATSKIASPGDLQTIRTFGFRGEALPSIAAAARLTLESAGGDGAGTRVLVDFGRMTECEPCSRPRGTRVAVRDLFAQLPARRKFLRAEATELRHCVVVLGALAFAHPEVTFRLDQGSRTLLDLPATRSASQRLPDLVGPERARTAQTVSHRAGAIEITGFLVPTRGGREMVVTVNGRVVRDRLLSGAINRALRGASGALEAEAFLALQLPLDSVDVNVHPTKAEVRFESPGQVMSAIAQALAPARQHLHGPAPIRRIVTLDATVPADQPRLPFAPIPGSSRVSEAAGEGWPVPDVTPPATCHTPLGRYIGQYRETYLVIEDEEGLLLVDQHVAHERVLFEALMAQTHAHPATQRLLLPEVVELPPDLASLATDAADDLATLGLEIEAASGQTVRVLGVPAALAPAGAAALVERLLADLALGVTTGATLRERAAASLACQAAIKKNRPLPRTEAEHLLARLRTLDDPHRCPHGRPIMLRLPHAEIERRIGRR